MDQFSLSLNRSHSAVLAGDIFDLMCGTGTGVITSRRLRMSMDDAIKEYSISTSWPSLIEAVADEPAVSSWTGGV